MDSDNKKITQLAVGVPVGTDIMPYVSSPGVTPVTKYTLVSSLGGGGFNSGFMTNGKIVPSVSSNNLTVALKTLAGADPSATDKVQIRIGDVVRDITSALSVTKNAGTNWMNAGGAGLATKEIDYFVYIGYNATDGITIGFSRIPTGRIYSDFSATSTNEKYCAISTITNAAAGDNYVVIGRFAATLSAGAGYTWTVPTFTSINLINYPIWNTRILSYAPTITSGAGTPTTVTTVSTYYIDKHKLEIKHIITVTDKGTASGSMIAPHPFTLTTREIMNGVETLAVGYMCFGLSAVNTSMYLYKYDVTTLWTNTHVFTFNCQTSIP
jgi:hypothetical protein